MSKRKQPTPDAPSGLAALRGLAELTRGITDMKIERLHELDLDIDLDGLDGLKGIGGRCGRYRSFPVLIPCAAGPGGSLPGGTVPDGRDGCRRRGPC